MGDGDEEEEDGDDDGEGEEDERLLLLLLWPPCTPINDDSWKEENGEEDTREGGRKTEDKSSLRACGVIRSCSI